MDNFDLMRGVISSKNFTKGEKLFILYVLTYSLSIITFSEKEIAYRLNLKSDRQVINILNSLHARKIVHYHYRRNKYRIIALNTEDLEKAL